MADFCIKKKSLVLIYLNLINCFARGPPRQFRLKNLNRLEEIEMKKEIIDGYEIYSENGEFK